MSVRAALGFMLTLAALTARAQVTFDNAADGASPNRMRYPLTVGSGTNRALAVFLHLVSECGAVDPTVGSVTYAGVPLVLQLATPQTGCTGTISQLWALPPGTQPATGTNDVEVALVGNVTSRRTLHSGAISATGVDQTTTFTTMGGNTGTGTAASVTLAANGANDLVIDSVCTAVGVTSTAQTQRWRHNESNVYSCDNSGGATAPGGTTNLSWTVASGGWDILGAAFKAAAAQTATIDAFTSALGGYALAYPMTVGSGSNRALAVFTHTGGTCGFAQPVVSGVTYGGAPLSLVLTRAMCPETHSELWALPPGTEPVPGTQDVVVTLSGMMTTSGSLHSGAISAAGVDQTNTFTSVAADSGVSGLPAVVLPSSSPADLVISSACNGDGVTGTPQTQRWVRNLTNHVSCDNSAGATADGGTTSLSWSGFNSTWVMVGASLKAGPAVAGTDAGTDGGTDAGVDGGPPGAGGLTLAVGCDCASMNGSAAVWAFLLVALGMRRARSRTPTTGERPRRIQ